MPPRETGQRTGSSPTASSLCRLGTESPGPGHKIQGAPPSSWCTCRVDTREGVPSALPPGCLACLSPPPTPQSQPYSRSPVKTYSDQQDWSCSASKAQPRVVVSSAPSPSRGYPPAPLRPQEALSPSRSTPGRSSSPVISTSWGSCLLLQ